MDGLLEEDGLVNYSPVKLARLAVRLGGLVFICGNGNLGEVLNAQGAQRSPEVRHFEV